MYILHALFTRYLGGLEQAYINDTDALSSLGHKVTALLRDDAPYREEVEKHAASVITIKPTGFYDIAAAWKIRALLKQMRPDVIVAHNGRAISLLAYASWGMRIPLCGVSHSYKTARAFHADHLVVLSNHMRDHFARAGYSKSITVIPNLMHLPPPPAFRKPGSPVVIGAMGRFSAEKGFANLLHALHELKKTRTPFIAKIAGDGQEVQKLRLLERKCELTPYIRWLGWIEDKEAFYNDIDILCIPSHEDSFPMVMIEALAHGIPLVATDVPGAISVLTDKVNGMIVPRKDPAAMAKALQQIIAQPEMAGKMARAAWDKAQDFAFDAVAKQWGDTLAALIASGTKPQAA